LCNTVKCQLYKVARLKLEDIVAESELKICLLEPELQNVVRASKGPNTLSPLEGLEGQWASSTVEEAVSLFSKTPIATVQVLCALP
jgi:hypothetical protein